MDVFCFPKVYQYMFGRSYYDVLQVVCIPRVLNVTTLMAGCLNSSLLFSSWSVLVFGLVGSLSAFWRVAVGLCWCQFFICQIWFACM